MSPTRFGTDGVRGVANVELTPELVLALGRAVARTISAATFLIGRDTRRSGPLLQSALSAGLASEGADVVDVGVLPTPALAWLSAERHLPAAVISASHNPFGDNGIKLFAAGGQSSVWRRNEPSSMSSSASSNRRSRAPGAWRATGWAPSPPNRDWVRPTSTTWRRCSEGRRLDGIRLVVDSANGSASSLAAGLYEGLGAEVVAIGCEPDGTNINDGCGSTSTGTLAGAVVDHRADLGLALDGDADRLLAVGPEGALVNGDELIALFALDLADRGQLAGKTVVVTVMTNLGFRLAMEERDIIVKETPVGDRSVLAALDKDGLSLGGEQSGHIIFRRLATTGDGLLTGLVLADLVVRAGRPLSALLEGLVTPVPQVLVNVPVPDIGLLDGADAVWSAVAEEEARLGEGGRVLLRPSGTEPLVRVMVEATGEGVAEAIAERLGKLVGFELQSAAATRG